MVLEGGFVVKTEKELYYSFTNYITPPNDL